MITSAILVCKTKISAVNKKSFLLITLLIFANLNPLNSQSLEGTYRYTGPAGLEGGELTFLSDQRFTHTTFSDMDKRKGQGYYVFNKEKLMLFYEEIFLEDSSYYLVEQEVSRVKSTTISLSVFDAENNEPFKSWIYLDKSPGGLQLSTDTLGQTEFIMWDDVTMFDSMRVAFPSYDPIHIDLKKLAGMINKINCYLRIPEYWPISESRKQYNIIGNKRDELILSNGNINERWKKVLQ